MGAVFMKSYLYLSLKFNKQIVNFVRQRLFTLIYMKVTFVDLADDQTKFYFRFKLNDEKSACLFYLLTTFSNHECF